MTKFVKYLREVKSEGKKIVWPSRKENISTLMLVLVVVIIASLFFGVVDWAVLSFVRGVLI